MEPAFELGKVPFVIGPVILAAHKHTPDALNFMRIRLVVSTVKDNVFELGL